MRRNVADRLQAVLCNRFRAEKPERELTMAEIENIWFTIYGRLCRGQTEKDVEEWCMTVELR